MGWRLYLQGTRPNNSGLRPEYPELMHPCSQGTRVEAQDRCGPVFSLDAPSGFLKDFMDLIPLRLLQGSYDG